MKTPILLCLSAAAMLSACSTDNYQPYATRGLNTEPLGERQTVTLERTACFGFCPVYKATVDDRDILVFEGERFVTEEGAVSKRLPKGTFKELLRIARAHDFTAYDAAYPNEDGSNCPMRATDMPTVIVSYDAGRLDHSVSLYQGCRFEGREALDEMILEIDAVMALDTMIGPREDFMGGQ